MIAYKLFRERRDGTITSLFIHREPLPTGVWMRAGNHPTDGFAVRPGWHCLLEPVAPHLSEKGRRWYRVEVRGVRMERRAASQGGMWVLAGQMKILEAYEKPNE